MWVGVTAPTGGPTGVGIHIGAILGTLTLIGDILTITPIGAGTLIGPMVGDITTITGIILIITGMVMTDIIQADMAAVA